MGLQEASPSLTFLALGSLAAFFADSSPKPLAPLWQSHRVATNSAQHTHSIRSAGRRHVSHKACVKPHREAGLPRPACGSSQPCGHP